MEVHQSREYRISAKDSLGNTFSEFSRIHFDYTVSQPNIVRLRIENQTLLAIADRPGKVVVRVFLDEDHSVQDFLEVFRQVVTFMY